MRIALLIAIACTLALPALGQPDAQLELELLVEDLGARSSIRRRKAERSLRAYGAEARAALHAAAQHGSPVVRAAVRRLLVHLGELPIAEQRVLGRALRRLFAAAPAGRDGAAQRMLSLGPLGQRALGQALCVEYDELTLEVLPCAAVVRAGQPWELRARVTNRGPDALMPLRCYARGSGRDNLVTPYDIRLTLARRGGGSHMDRAWPLAQLTRFARGVAIEKRVAGGRLSKPGRYPFNGQVTVGGHVRAGEEFSSGVVPVGAPPEAQGSRRDFGIDRSVLVLPDWTRPCGLVGGLSIEVTPRSPTVAAGDELLATVTLRNRGSEALKLPRDWARSAYVALAAEGAKGWVRWDTADELAVAARATLVRPREAKVVEVRVVVQYLELAPGGTASCAVRLRVPRRAASGAISLVAGLHLFTFEIGKDTRGMGHDGVPHGHAITAAPLTVRGRSASQAAVQSLARFAARSIVRPR